MAYWDTSALLKLYVAEADSPYFLQLITETTESVVSSAIAAAEVLCVLYRKEHARALEPGAARRLYRRFLSDVNAGRILSIPFGRDVEVEAEKLIQHVFARPQPVLVRSLDVIHLATALSAGSTKIVSTDTRLRNVAILAGLKPIP
jgi:predicted nucleic acid-binding protein